MMPGHPNGFVSETHCIFCSIYASNPTYRNAVDNGKVSRPAGDVLPLPCVHLGPELLGIEREEKGLDHSRTWHVCNIGHGQEGYVCPCKDCGIQRCTDYRL